MSPIQENKESTCNQNPENCLQDQEDVNEILLPCPYCGSETLIPVMEKGGYYVRCYESENCSYASPVTSSPREAIEAHNKICRELKDD